MSSARDTVLEAFYAAYNAGDAPTAAALYAPHGAHEEAASGKAREGRAEVEAGLRGFLGLLEALRFRQSGRIHAGDTALVNYVMEGEMTRDIGPFRAHGNTITLTGAHLFRFEGDAILRTTDFWNPEEFMAQVRPAPETA